MTMAKYKYSFKAYNSEGNIVIADNINADHFLVAWIKFLWRHRHSKHSFVNYSRYYIL